MSPSAKVKTFFGPGRDIFIQFGPREKKTGTHLPQKEIQISLEKGQFSLETLKKGQNS